MEWFGLKDGMTRVVQEAKPPGGFQDEALILPQYPNASPSFRGSEPPIRQPRARSIQIA